MESGKIIVVANQKGGVAKTSTVRNLSYALAEMGKKVLVVDFDPQYNLTTSFGVLPTQAPYNTGTLITNLLLDESLPDTNEFIQKIGSVDLIPSSRSLTVAEANLLMTPDSNDYLAKELHINCNDYTEAEILAMPFWERLAQELDELDRQAHEILQKEFPDDEDIPGLALTDITIDKSGCYGTFSLCYDTGDSPAGELYLNVSFDEQFVPSPKVGYDTF